MVRPETPVENVIEQMSQTGASAALVVETPESPEMGQILVGIFTEADIIQLSSIGDRLGGYRIAQIMIRSLVTVQEAELSDPFAIAALLAKHQISHLPVVNEFGGIVGLLTALNLLRQAQIQPLSSPENLNPEPLNPGADSGNLNPGNLNPQNLASTDALVLPADLIQLHQLAPCKPLR
ncbi:MAG: CBS domain-containing protein [Oscillatoriales cyanobacterium RM1_1_9]|nr:CBS domain-containing protein [Oscillatoriales cyanobacterium RM1_1_9]